MPESGNTSDPAASETIFRSPLTLAKLTTFSFLILLAGCAWFMWLSKEALSMADDPRWMNQLWADDFDARMRQMRIGLIASYVLNAVFFCMWTFRVAKNARSMSTREFAYSPGWAVGSYFIPVLNIWRPYQAMNEICAASTEDAPSQQKKMGALLLLWWLAWIGSCLTNYQLSNSGSEPLNVEQWADLHRRLLLANGIRMAAALIALAMLWKLTKIQIRRKAFPNAEAQFVDV